MDCYRNLKSFMQTPEMEEFNKKSKNFYSALLSSFNKFLLTYLEAGYIDDTKPSINFLEEIGSDADSDKRPKKAFLITDLYILATLEMHKRQRNRQIGSAIWMRIV
ncbi:hypothetical protein [Veillonella sp. VA139]|uniref:hypothetical protein n=1 Tax=Veillonella sp. VA139 TaxID=741830 RepID=UPI000F8D4AB1|nr:hypothetical protein [Veillonella sp. VA139]